MNPIKNTIYLYINNFEKIALLSLTICLPFLLLHEFTSNLIYAYVNFTPAQSFGDFSNLFLIMVFFVLVQLPFIQLVQCDFNDDEGVLKKCYQTFLQYGFSIFVFAVLYIILVIAGLTLFILPGVILLILFYLTPYVMVYKKSNPFKSMKIALRFGRKHFFQILGILLFMGTVELCLGYILLILVSKITLAYLAIFFSQLLLNLVLFPFFTFFTTFCFNKWIEQEEKNANSVNIALKL